MGELDVLSWPIPRLEAKIAMTYHGWHSADPWPGQVPYHGYPSLQAYQTQLSRDVPPYATDDEIWAQVEIAIDRDGLREDYEKALEYVQEKEPGRPLGEQRVIAAVWCWPDGAQ